jgi:hypothetical protein
LLQRIVLFAAFETEPAKQRVTTRFATAPGFICNIKITYQNLMTLIPLLASLQASATV